MLSSLVVPLAAPAVFEHTPYPPPPFHPRQGGKGSLTATFDCVAPNALLRSQGCHCVFAQRFRGYGRRALVAIACANGGRVAARMRGSEPGAAAYAERRDLGAIARANGGRAAARSVRTNARAFTTTAGSPTPAPTSATQPHSGSTVFGAQPPNRLLAPLSALARVERGWGIGGEFKAIEGVFKSSAGKNIGETKWI